MKAPNDGFTLIEMVVVLAIIAILALFAIPSYQSRIIRGQVLEAGPLIDVAKKQVAGAWGNAHTLPLDNPSAELPVPEKMVSNVVASVTIEAGAIHVTFGNRANKVLQGKVLTIRPAIVEDAPIVPVAWACGYAPVPGSMTAKGENRTNIPANYLPPNCQAG
jgi:type IV pilus assembly protein PilA